MQLVLSLQSRLVQSVCRHISRDDLKLSAESIIARQPHVVVKTMMSYIVTLVRFTLCCVNHHHILLSN